MKIETYFKHFSPCLDGAAWAEQQQKEKETIEELWAIADMPLDYRLWILANHFDMFNEIGPKLHALELKNSYVRGQFKFDIYHATTGWLTDNRASWPEDYEAVLKCLMSFEAEWLNFIKEVVA